MKTLNEQYQLIKEGKGHKGVFLNEAKRQFPNYIRNAATFEETTTILKQKGVINENLVGLSPINTIETSKKESFELAFEKFIEEAKDPQIKAKEVKGKTVKSQEEDEKAELKKSSKQVEEDLAKGYDHSDKKNLDNVIYGQLMKGYYAEMKDPKNEDKTMEQIRDIVLKNLEKDPTHYVKDGQFGVKGLGYVTEHPGLGTPKEPTGKYKASGYGDLKESKLTLSGTDKAIKMLKSELKNNKVEFETEGNKVIVDDSPKTKMAIKMVKERTGMQSLKLNESILAENKLRKVIRAIINEELEEVTESITEGIEKDLAAINKEAEHEALQNKLDKVQALIDKKQTQLNRLDEDEDMKDLTDKKKVKEIEKDIKALEKAKSKIEKMMSKGKGKKKEVIEDAVEDPMMDEMYLEDTTEEAEY
jgi:hypothetical protein